MLTVTISAPSKKAISVAMRRFQRSSIAPARRSGWRVPTWRRLSNRLSVEPGTSAESLKLLSGILASSHRLVHGMMALEAGLLSSHPAPAREPFRRFADDVELTVYY